MLVTQSFGKENEYRRAIFAIWSYWAYQPSGHVLLFTDAPGFFKKYFDGQPIEYVLLTPAKIKEMRGRIDFLHRMKIALLDEAFKRTDADLLYIDSDTFFIADPKHKMIQVSEAKSFMHVCEYRFDSLLNMELPAAEPFHAFLNLITHNEFNANSDVIIKTSPLHFSWNAGAMMLHRSHARLLPDVFALTDRFYPTTKNHASEQYAFSIVLQNNTELKPCDDVVYHYWYRIKKTLVDSFLQGKMTSDWQELPVETKVSMVKNWAIILPALLETHVLTLRDNAIQAFHERKPRRGYIYSFRALMKDPFDYTFLKDVLYHTRKWVVGK